MPNLVGPKNAAVNSFFPAIAILSLTSSLNRSHATMNAQAQAKLYSQLIDHYEDCLARMAIPIGRGLAISKIGDRYQVMLDVIRSQDEKY